MHVFTDSKIALREAVMRKSARISPWELIAGGNGDHTHKELITRLTKAGHRQRGINGYTKAVSKPGREQEVELER